MRIWLDPDMVAAYNLRADEVLAALRAQNLQVSYPQSAASAG
jgi:multidrug efflux pump subunit AcrB